MGIETILGAVAGPLIGGIMGADASSSAADAQIQASREANQLNRDVFNKQVELNDPFRRAGLGAQNRLMTLLGLQGGPAATGLGGGTASPERNALRQQLLSKFTSQPGQSGGGNVRGTVDNGFSIDPVAGGSGAQGPSPGGSGGSLAGYQADNQQNQQNYQPDGGAASTVDEAGLNAEIDRQLGANQPQVGGDTTDPAYGSLMRDFSKEDMNADPIYADLKPGMDRSLARTEADMNSRGDFANSLDHRFSMADYQEDPGYQFRLDQGNKGLERTAAARGGALSGRAAKDAMAWNSGQASQEYGRASDRFNADRSFAANDYGNAYNRFAADRSFGAGQRGDAFNRFQINRGNKLNPLQALMGGAQTATGQMSNAAQNYGGQASQNIIGAGNAQAAGQIGGANAIAGAIGQGYNNYQTNKLMGRVWGPTGGGQFGSGSAYGNQDLGQYL